MGHSADRGSPEEGPGRLRSPAQWPEYLDPVTRHEPAVAFDEGLGHDTDDSDLDASIADPRTTLWLVAVRVILLAVMVLRRPRRYGRGVPRDRHHVDRCRGVAARTGRLTRRSELRPPAGDATRSLQRCTFTRLLGVPEFRPARGMGGGGTVAPSGPTCSWTPIDQLGFVVASRRVNDPRLRLHASLRRDKGNPDGAWAPHMRPAATPKGTFAAPNR